MGTDKGKYIKVDGGPVVYPISTCPLLETPQSIVYMLTLPVEMLKRWALRKGGCELGMGHEGMKETVGGYTRGRYFGNGHFPGRKPSEAARGRGKAYTGFLDYDYKYECGGCEEEEDATWKTHGR